MLFYFILEVYMKSIERKFYTANEMAKILGISKITLLAWCKAKKDLPPVVKNPGKFLFPISGYKEWKQKKEGKNND